MILPVYNVRFSSEIAVHLQIAIDYYDQLSPGLGEKFLSEFEIQIVGVSQNPHGRAIRYDDVRFALISRFHYAIHYYIREPNKEVVAFALYSTYIDPETNWKRPDSIL